MKYPTLQELLEAGVHFGHKASRAHPKMKPFIYGIRDGVSIIDLTLSDKYLKEACEYVSNLSKDNKILLFVATKKQSQSLVSDLAKKVGAPYLINRWVGGFLSNFEQIQKNVKKLKDLRDQKEKGELEKYTKKEQLLLDREINRLTLDYEGVLELEGKPDAIFIVDAVKEKTAVTEARRLELPLVGIADSNSDISLIDYPIPGNDDAIKSITIIVETVANAYEEGKKRTVEGGKLKVDKEDGSPREAGKLKMEGQTVEEVLADEVKEEVAEVEEEVEKEEVKESERKE